MNATKRPFPLIDGVLLLPLPGVADYATAVRTRPGSSPYKELLGMIPAEESDDDFLIAMEAME